MYNTSKTIVKYSHYNYFLLEHYCNLLFVNSCKVNGQRLFSVQHNTSRFLDTALFSSNDKLGFKTKKNSCCLIVNVGVVKLILQLCYCEKILRVRTFNYEIIASKKRT